MAAHMDINMPDDTNVDVQSIINVTRISSTSIWTLQNYSHHGKTCGQYIEQSINFGEINNRKVNEWIIRLYPAGRNQEFSEYVSIYLKPGKHNKCPADARFRVCIVSSVMKNGFIKEFNRPIEYRSTRGWKKFLRRTTLLNPNNRCLPGDVMTIRCSVTLTELSDEPLRIRESHLSQDLNALLTNHAHSDVVLVVDGEELRAHKLILSARSPVFAAMFGQDYAENSSNRVHIVDMSCAALKAMLSFIYSGKVVNLDENAQELLVAANKYGLERLHEMCEESLVANLTIENSARVLRLADLHRADQLKIKCVNFIESNMKDVIETDGWKLLKQSCSIMIVDEIIEKQAKRMQ